jgi:hypothetical protein
MTTWPESQLNSLGKKDVFIKRPWMRTGVDRENRLKIVFSPTKPRFQEKAQSSSRDQRMAATNKSLNIYIY